MRNRLIRGSLLYSGQLGWQIGSAAGRGCASLIGNAVGAIWAPLLAPVAQAQIMPGVHSMTGWAAQLD